jgi:hypothetical protein
MAFLFETCVGVYIGFRLRSHREEVVQRSERGEEITVMKLSSICRVLSSSDRRSATSQA